MSAKGGARILGPYDQRPKGWRVIEIDPRGGPNGKPKRESIMFETEAKALRYIELFKAALEKADHTTESAWREYRAHMTAEGRKADSIATCEWALRLFFPEPEALASLTSKRCQRLYDELRTRPSKTGKPLAADSHRTALAYMKAFLSWCARSPRNWIAVNPFADVKGAGKRRPRGKSLGKSGNEIRVQGAREWYGTALAMADEGDQGAIAGLVALLLGMRASEIVSRRVADLDSDAAPGDLLWIPCSKTPAGRRTLEVPEVLRPYLLRLAKNKHRDVPLFEAKPGIAHPREWVRKVVHRVCDKAKVPRVTAHAMRGLLATLSAERGLAGHLIAATLGHTSYEGMTLKAYAAPGSHETGVNRRGLVVLSGGAK